MEEPKRDRSKTIFGETKTWNVTRNRTQKKETCNQKRNIVQLITTRCYLNLPQNTRWSLPTGKIHHDRGTTQQQ